MNRQQHEEKQKAECRPTKTFPFGGSHNSLDSGNEEKLRYTTRCNVVQGPWRNEKESLAVDDETHVSLKCRTGNVFGESS